jgi:hypothetical protein
MFKYAQAEAKDVMCWCNRVEKILRYASAIKLDMSEEKERERVYCPRALLVCLFYSRSTLTPAANTVE